MSEKKTIIFGVAAAIIFVGAIVYNFVDFPIRTIEKETSLKECIKTVCPALTCEEPEIIYESYPEYLPEYIEKIITTTTTMEVIDKTCEDNFMTMKKDLQSLIYTACVEKHQFCNYLLTN